MKHIGDNDSQSDFVTLLRMKSGQESEPDFVLVEHAYALPWNSQSETTLAQPRKTLFLSKLPRGTSSGSSDEYIDVENVSCDSSILPYNVDKGRHLMKECERHVVFAKLSQTGPTTKEPEDDEDSDNDWVEKLNKQGWTEAQGNLFSSITKILDSDYLAKLTLHNTDNEPVKQRAVIDKTSGKFTQAMSRIGWDMKLAQWLHNTLLLHMSTPYIASYLDILQTLKSKIPTLIDRMISNSFSQKRPNFEALNLLLKRPWDPVSPIFNQFKPLKMENLPIVIQVPSGAGMPNVPLNIRRFRFFNIQLQHLVKYVSISHTSDNSDGITVLDSIISDVRKKILEYKEQFPSQPIVLLGWGVGALLACHISLVEMVSANICLGFPMKTFDGMRGRGNDPLLGMTTPTLFVIGQNSTDVNIDGIEEFRQHLHTQTSLVVIAGGGNLMKVSADKCYVDGITQSMVDRCIVDEIGEFLTRVFNEDTNTKESSAISNSNNYSSGSTTAFTNPLPPKTNRKELPRKRKLSPSNFSDSGNILSLSKASKTNETRTAISQNLGLKIPIGVSSVIPSLKCDKNLSVSSPSSHVHFSLASKSSTNNTDLPLEISDANLKRRQPGHLKDGSSTFRLQTGSDTNFDLANTKPVASPFDSCTLSSGSASPMATIALGALASVSRQKYQRMIQISDSSDIPLSDNKNIYGWNAKPSGKVDSDIGIVGISSVANMSSVTRGDFHKERSCPPVTSYFSTIPAFDSSSEFPITDSEVKKVPQQHQKQYVSACLSVGVVHPELNTINYNGFNDYDKKLIECQNSSENKLNTEFCPRKTNFHSGAIQNCMIKQPSPLQYASNVVMLDRFQPTTTSNADLVLLNNAEILPSPFPPYENILYEGILTPPYSPTFSFPSYKQLPETSFSLPSNSLLQPYVSACTFSPKDTSNYNCAIPVHINTYPSMLRTDPLLSLSPAPILDHKVTKEREYDKTELLFAPFGPEISGFNNNCLNNTVTSNCSNQTRPYSYPYSQSFSDKPEINTFENYVVCSSPQIINHAKTNQAAEHEESLALNGNTIIQHLKDLCNEIGLSPVHWKDLLPVDPNLFEQFLNGITSNKLEQEKLKEELFKKITNIPNADKLISTSESFYAPSRACLLSFPDLNRKVDFDIHNIQKHSFDFSGSNMYKLGGINNYFLKTHGGHKFNMQTMSQIHSKAFGGQSKSPSLAQNVFQHSVDKISVPINGQNRNCLPPALQNCNSIAFKGRNITLPKPIMSLIPMQPQLTERTIHAPSTHYSSDTLRKSSEKCNLKNGLDLKLKGTMYPHKRFKLYSEKNNLDKPFIKVRAKADNTSTEIYSKCNELGKTKSFPQFSLASRQNSYLPEVKIIKEKNKPSTSIIETNFQDNHMIHIPFRKTNIPSSFKTIKCRANYTVKVIYPKPQRNVSHASNKLFCSDTLSKVMTKSNNDKEILGGNVKKKRLLQNSCWVNSSLEFRDIDLAHCTDIAPSSTTSDPLYLERTSSSILPLPCSCSVPHEHFNNILNRKGLNDFKDKKVTVDYKPHNNIQDYPNQFEICGSNQIKSYAVHFCGIHNNEIKDKNNLLPMLHTESSAKAEKVLPNRENNQQEAFTTLLEKDHTCHSHMTLPVSGSSVSNILKTAPLIGSAVCKRKLGHMDRDMDSYKKFAKTKRYEERNCHLMFGISQSHNLSSHNFCKEEQTHYNKALENDQIGFSDAETGICMSNKYFDSNIFSQNGDYLKDPVIQKRLTDFSYVVSCNKEASKSGLAIKPYKMHVSPRKNMSFVNGNSDNLDTIMSDNFEENVLSINEPVIQTKVNSARKLLFRSCRLRHYNRLSTNSLE